MSYQPSDLTVAGAIVTNSPVVGANLTTPLVAAPGGGLRIRLWAVKAIWRRAGSGDAELVMLDSGGAGLGGYLALSDEQRADTMHYPGGMATLSANRGVSIQHQGSIASSPMLVGIFYTVEAV